MTGVNDWGMVLLSAVYVAIMAGLTAGCATSHIFVHTVNVRVQQLDGTPIRASVNINSQVHKTNKLGVAKAFKLQDKDLWIVTYADGFVTQTSRLYTGAASTTVVVLMEVKPTPVARPQVKKEKKK